MFHAAGQPNAIADNLNGEEPILGLACVHAIQKIDFSGGRPLTQTRARMTIQEEDNIVWLQCFIDGLPVLRMPPVGVEAAVAHQDRRPSCLANMLCQIPPQECQRSLGIMPDRIVFDLRMLSVGRIDAELHKMNVVPIPRIVQPVFGKGGEPSFLLPQQISFSVAPEN